MATASKAGKKRWLLFLLLLFLAWYLWRHRAMPVAQETPQKFDFGDDQVAPNLSYLTTNGYAPGQTDVDSLSHLAQETRDDLNKRLYTDRVTGKFNPPNYPPFPLWDAWQFFLASNFQAERDDAAAQIGEYWKSKGIG